MNLRIKLFLVLVVMTLGCTNTSEENSEKRLVKISIMYPSGEGRTFNMNYYKNNHMPMLKKLFGPTMKKYVIDKGLRGRTVEDEIPFLAMGHMYFETISDYENVFGQHHEKILGDIPNYTNIRPIVQISEVVP